MNVFVQTLKKTDQPRISNSPVAFKQQLKWNFSTYTPYNLTPRLSGSFAFTVLKANGLYMFLLCEIFGLNFVYSHSHHHFCKTSTHFLIIICLKKTFSPKKPFWKIAVLTSIFLDLFLNFLFAKNYITHDSVWE